MARARIAGRRPGSLAAALALLAGLIAAALLAGAGSHATAQQLAAGAHRPNIIVVMTDDQNVGDDKVMKRVQHDLVNRGVTFENFFATFPLCCPSRTTYLTGQYAHNHGVESNTPRTGGGFPAFDDSKTTAVALHRDGYEVAQIGKFLNGYPGVANQNPDTIPAGFDRWFVALNKTMYDWSADDQGVIRQYSGQRKYQTNVYARKAVDFVKDATDKGKPFWLTVATHAPHGESKVKNFPNPRPAPRDYGRFDNVPLPKPPSFNEKDVSDKPAFLQVPRLKPKEIEELREKYDSRLASLLAVDRLVGRLVDQVRSLHEMRDTWFMFTSDNGYLFGQHRMTRKTVLYDESARVPLIIRGPKDELPRGVTRKQFAGNIDLSPTILDIAGVRPLLTVDGVSLLPVAADPRRHQHRDILLENEKSQALRTRHWMYAEHDTNDDSVPDEFELYNMKSDPYQLRNRYQASLDPLRHSKLATARQQLALRLDQLRNCAGRGGADPCD